MKLNEHLGNHCSTFQDMMEQKDDWQDHNATVELLAATRSRKRTVDNGNEQSESVLTPAHVTITRSRSTAGRQMVVPCQRSVSIFRRAQLAQIHSLYVKSSKFLHNVDAFRKSGSACLGGHP